LEFALGPNGLRVGREGEGENAEGVVEQDRVGRADVVRERRGREGRKEDKREMRKQQQI
jgi:hypothetical protein